MDIRKEIQFWTRIMRDHAEFQLNSLAPMETNAINTADYFMRLFNELYSESGSSTTVVPALINKSKNAVINFIDFKRNMLAGLMTCNIKLGLTPSFLNHMINEALEFLHILNLADKTTPYNQTLENIRLHKIWLPDASGHASTVAADLDAIEAEYVNKANEFSKRFDKLFKKAFEMYTMYERTGLENGALHYFNMEVVTALSEFIIFLEKVEELREECSLFSTGTFLPLMPNHMMREEGYYIYKINELGKRFG